MWHGSLKRKTCHNALYKYRHILSMRTLILHVIRAFGSASLSYDIHAIILEPFVGPGGRVALIFLKTLLSYKGLKP